MSTPLRRILYSGNKPYSDFLLDVFTRQSLSKKVNRFKLRCTLLRYVYFIFDVAGMHSHPTQGFHGFLRCVLCSITIMAEPVQSITLSLRNKDQVKVNGNFFVLVIWWCYANICFLFETMFIVHPGGPSGMVHPIP